MDLKWSLINMEIWAFIFFSLIIIGLIIFNVRYIIKTRQLSERLKEKENQYSKLLSQKKSSEVRLGHISEKLAPFLEDFEFNPRYLTFLGQPIDYIHFSEEAITFIEVKSGKSQLTKKQRRIRDIIKNGNINWYEFNIS